MCFFNHNKNKSKTVLIKVASHETIFHAIFKATKKLHRLNIELFEILSSISHRMDTDFASIFDLLAVHIYTLYRMSYLRVQKLWRLVENAEEGKNRYTGGGGVSKMHRYRFTN